MNRVIGIVGISMLVTACGGQGVNMGSVAGVDVGTALGAATDLTKAATLTEQEVIDSSRQMRLYEEQNKETVAPASGEYSQRLAKLTDKLGNYDGLNLNFKAYLSDSVNANATADGSVRVYTALMDLMDDDELLFVIGHEIGHVKNGHSAAEMRTALALSGIRKGAAATGTVAGDLAASKLGGLLEAVVNAQYSQSQETESDDYGLQFLRKTGGNLNAAASALRKLAELSGGQHSILSSHPEAAKRAERMAEMIKQG
ncbi:MAG: M48 family metalloprotease [Gammaproteobacteria bacterium]